MLEKLRQRLLEFIYSPKDTPILAGLSVGAYMVLYYYSKNFSLANSLQQLLFFIGYYIALPVVVIFAGYKLMGLLKLPALKRNFIFVAIISFLAFFLIQISFIGFSKKLAFAGIFVLAALLSIKFKRYYKLLILLLFLMSLFNVPPVAKNFYFALASSGEWKKQPDDIIDITFKQKPNIYYIQPDGYTSFSNLRDSIHNFDNSAFEGFLKESGFTLYDDFRSNYFSTLLSNSSMLWMKHHYLEKDIEAYSARRHIVSENPVLEIVKKNGYMTHFITEMPYLVINRPEMGFDYCNIDYSTLPYLRDGWGMEHDVFDSLRQQMKDSSGSNFYFIEKLTPGHIHGLEVYSEGAEAEKDMYLEKVQEANAWLKQVISHINAKDPRALIIIGADHGGFAGFEYTGQSVRKTGNPMLVRSIFGAALAIKWNNTQAGEYDRDLHSCVNLFRTVFSFLARDKKYLEHIQEDDSYIRMVQPSGVYRHIDDNGNVVFEKR